MSQTLELRASIVIGSGSLSFELVRALVERLPVMVTPRWVRSVSQPIAIEDVVAYLEQAADVTLDGSEVVEIGGADRVSYEQLMHEYARQRGLRRVMVPVPLLDAAPVVALARARHAGVRAGWPEAGREPAARDGRPRGARRRGVRVRPRGAREAIARALANEDREIAETRWSDALSAGERGRRRAERRAHGRVLDSRTVEVDGPPARAFAPIRRIGGATGWYYGNRSGGSAAFSTCLPEVSGSRRGRGDPETPGVGAALDFWRVEAYEPDRLLRLRAEMRVPGRAWLQFEVEGDERGSTIRQTAIFDPVGLAGLAYWYGLKPLHDRVFGGMLAGIAKRARSG